MRLSFRKQAARCVCANGPDAPSTHRGAAHFDPRCPHSTLLDTTQRYAERREADEAKREKKRKAEKARRGARPVRRVVL